MRSPPDFLCGFDCCPYLALDSLKKFRIGVFAFALGCVDGICHAPIENRADVFIRNLWIRRAIAR